MTDKKKTVPAKRVRAQKFESLGAVRQEMSAQYALHKAGKISDSTLTTRGQHLTRIGGVLREELHMAKIEAVEKRLDALIEDSVVAEQ